MHGCRPCGIVQASRCTGWDPRATGSSPPTAACLNIASLADSLRLVNFLNCTFVAASALPAAATLAGTAADNAAAGDAWLANEFFPGMPVVDEIRIVGSAAVVDAVTEGASEMLLVDLRVRCILHVHGSNRIQSNPMEVGLAVLAPTYMLMLVRRCAVPTPHGIKRFSHHTTCNGKILAA